MKRTILLIFMIIFLGCGGGSDPVVYVPPVEGCTDSTACNYNPEAEADDETCEYDACVGCTDEIACNYNENADTDDGTCDFDSCSGCTSDTACNYDESATIDDGSCYATIDTFTQLIDGNGSQVESACLMPDNTIYITSIGNVLYNVSQDIYGFQITDISGATIDDATGSDWPNAFLSYSSTAVVGIDVSLASSVPAGCGILAELSLSGTVTQAEVIVSANAGDDIGASYLLGCNCELSSALDCVGVCGGDTLYDDCGVCAGDSSTCTDCLGVPNGSAITCGVSGSGNGDDYCVSQETCDDRIAVQAIIAANPNSDLVGENIDNLVTWNEEGRAIHLDLSNKGISTMPNDIEDLSELRLLDLSYNNFSILASEIFSLTKLTHLTLTQNGLTSLPGDIGNLESLINLTVEGNNITSLHENIVLLSNLQTLNVVSNGLTELPSLIGLNNLETIYATSNSLSSLPTTIQSLSALNYLDVSSNPQLASLPSGICSCSISTLIIAGTQITCDDLDTACSNLNIPSCD